MRRESPTLVLNCDDGYAMPLAVTLRSVVEATGHWPIDVRVLTNRFSSTHRERVLQSLPSGSVELQWIEIEELPNVRTQSHIPAITCARLFMTRVLEPSLSRAIYIDADILVLADLGELWHVDLEGASIGAVVDGIDLLLQAGSEKVLRVPGVERYFNAGILLIDLDRWRSERVCETALEYLASHPSSPFTDQDALNVACDARWKSLDPRWNFQYHLRVRPEQLVGDARPFVIHFVTSQKPWKADSFSAYARMYDGFRSRTAYRRTRLDELSDLTSVAAFHCKQYLKQYRFVRWALAHRLARH